MQGIIRKWGNSAAIRLPSSLLETINLKIDQPVELIEQDGKLVIVPCRSVDVSLNDLVNNISDDNKHDEFFTEDPIGQESW